MGPVMFVYKILQDVEVAGTGQYQGAIRALDNAGPVNVFLNPETHNPQAAHAIRVEAERSVPVGLLARHEKRLRQKIGYVPDAVARAIRADDRIDFERATLKRIKLLKDLRTFGVFIDIPLSRPEFDRPDIANVVAVAVRRWAPPVCPPGVTPHVGPYDEPQLDGDDLSFAEGQFFVIEYEDARNRLSTRRVTVWGTRKLASGATALLAQCHERLSPRAFRIDRIRSVIDCDGRLHSEPAAFLRDIFGLSGRTAILGVSDDWPDLRRRIRPHVQLMAALCRQDGHAQKNEAVALLPYFERMAPEFGALENRIRLMDYLKRSRPVPDIVGDVLSEIRDMPRSRRLDLLLVCRTILGCTSILRPDRVALFNLVCEDLIDDTLL